MRPMFTGIITTCDTYEDDQKKNGIIDMSKRAGAIKECQTVVAVGTDTRGINIGDYVMIDPTRFAVMKHEKGSLRDGVITDNPVLGYKFPTVDINGVKHLSIDIRDIAYVIEEYEEVEDAPEPKPSGIVIPKAII